MWQYWGLGLKNWSCFSACLTTCSVYDASSMCTTKMSSQIKTHMTLPAPDFAHAHAWNIILNQARQQFKCSFIPIVYPCCALSAAWRFPLHPPCPSLLPLLHILNDGWHFPPHTAICCVESRPDALAYLSSATQTSKSALASQRDGKAPPGSRRRLQSSRCSPGIKYPFR